MNQKEIEDKAFDYFQSGFHCAESIVKAFSHLYPNEINKNIVKLASGFGGGMGASHCDVCGALSGGVLVIGSLFGRSTPSDDKKKVLSLANELRNQFIEKNKSTACEFILKQFGIQENGMKCKKLTAQTAGVLFTILKEKNKGN